MKGRFSAFIGVLKDSKNPVRVILAQLLVKTGLHKFFNIRLNGYNIKFSKSALAITLFANPDERHDDEDFLRKVLKPGDVYVDVGANIGTLVLAAASITGPFGKVVAIEAHPSTFKILEENIKLNKLTNIDAKNFAVGNKKGTVFFSNINSDDQNKVLVKSEAGIEVAMETLDNLLAGLERITILKIDVEGYEKFVLEGAFETLSKASAVYFESWQQHFNVFNYTTEDILAIFDSNGFKVYEVMNNILTPLLPRHISVSCQNLLAIKDLELFCQKYNFRISD